MSPSLATPPTALGQIVDVDGVRWFAGRQRSTLDPRPGAGRHCLHWCRAEDLAPDDARWYGLDRSWRAAQERERLRLSHAAAHRLEWEQSRVPDMD